MIIYILKKKKKKMNLQFLSICNSNFNSPGKKKKKKHSQFNDDTGLHSLKLYGRKLKKASEYRISLPCYHNLAELINKYQICESAFSVSADLSDPPDGYWCLEYV